MRWGCVAIALAALGVLTAIPTVARATHQRASLISWAPTTGNTVEFTITGAWRRSAYSTANGRCRDINDTTPPVLGNIACTGGDGYAGVGDVIAELQGNTVFNAGDSSTISSPLNALLYVVTSVDVANDWLYATALDPNSLPSIDTTISKTYSNNTARTAYLEDCCRVSNPSSTGGNHHINNPDGNYRIETRVTPGGSNRPPVSTMPPVVLCPRNGVCTFQIPASDPDGDAVTFRLSTSTEASGSSTGFKQPGPTAAPNAATISSSGVYNWNTTGATVAAGSGTTYYSTQVTIEDRTPGDVVKSRIAVDFLIQVVEQQAGVPPVFDHPPTPQCGSTISVNPGSPVSFTIQASDVDFGQTVTLNAVGMPSGASFAPGLPITANPVSSMFSWLPGGFDAGTTHIVAFTATDSASLQTQCSVTIQVGSCQNNAHCDDGNLCTTDICAPGDPGANAGGCLNTAVTCDACQVCQPNLGCTGAVCTPIYSPTPTATATITPTPTVTNTGTVPPTSTFTDTPTPTETPVPFCGDGTIDPGETCDDGNGFDGDGCDSNCTPSTACALVYPGTERFVGACGAPSYADIQAAVDAAANGDIVTVCPGTYTQSVQVTKQVKIRATTAGTVTVHTTGTAFDIVRSGVTIDQLTIQSDTGAAISANALCPLGQVSCASPGRGTNLTITKNTILDSPVGIRWQRRIDCAEILDNTMTGNAAHIELLQQEGAPAVLVSIIDNEISGGGNSGAAVSLSGLGATLAANTIATSGGAGLVLANVPGAGATQVIENVIRDNEGDGITVGVGADGVRIHDNNIADNEVGLNNVSGAGTLDATLNWWDSQSGPSGLFTGHGDSIVNGAGSTTEFIEFLCKPFPQGFASVLGMCSVETAELTQLVPGRSPDLDQFGKYLAFESAADMDVDGRTAYNNSDASQEIYLLNRRPKKKLGGVCLGGLLGCDFTDLQACTACNGRRQCPGDPGADPIVLNGECVLLTQLSDGGGGTTSRQPRLSGSVKAVAYDTNADAAGDNPDGSREIVSWQRSLFEKLQPPISVYSSGQDPVSFENPSPSRNGKVIVLESNGNPTGGNPDGNTEIFIYRPRSHEWVQLTNTLPPVENRHPTAPGGARVLFDSTGDLHNDPLAPGINNADGNRELFMARIRSSGIEFHQITDTVIPAESVAGTLDGKSAVAAFSSTADLIGQNADGNQEIFTWSRRSNAFEQVTHSAAGESAHPTINLTQRYVVFESTADLTNSGANNRRIFQFDRLRGQLFLLSRSRFGTNQVPRISQRRYVVWESTANLTGNNPAGNWVIYIFDRKRD
ncbi:MAG: right-handed parallel beta-helix repeat-containing protein [bacterium]